MAAPQPGGGEGLGRSMAARSALALGGEEVADETRETLWLGLGPVNQVLGQQNMGIAVAFRLWSTFARLRLAVRE